MMCFGIQLRRATQWALLCCVVLSAAVGGDTDTPIVDDDLIFAVRDGMAAVEAEHFVSQSMTDTRAFHLTTADRATEIKPDCDPQHVAGASSGAYLEVLPDTRRTHADKLIKGTNF